MLSFLVTSNTRRRLLHALWGAEADGPVSDLAQRCGVSFASAHRELRAMRQAGLATSVRSAGRTVYRANTAHPQAELVRQLVSAPVVSDPHEDKDAQDVRRRLKTLGAPLNGRAMRRANVDVEETLVAGVKLARQDATVARVMPLCLWHERSNVDWKKLLASVHGAEEKHTLGFFLELTTELSGDERFKSCAVMLRDKRVRTVHDFSMGRKTSSARELAEAKTPQVARDWGFRMNMESESFQSTFDKFAELDERA